MLRHLGDFPRRLREHCHAVYEFTPCPPVGYPEVEASRGAAGGKTTPAALQRLCACPGSPDVQGAVLARWLELACVRMQMKRDLLLQTRLHCEEPGRQAACPQQPAMRMLPLG